MPLEGYTTVFLASDQPFPWWSVVLALFMVGVPVGVIIRRNQLPEDRRFLGVAFAALFLMASLCIGIYLVASKISDYSTAKSMLANNKAQVVEGPVENLTVTAYGKAENFTVQGVSFSYSEYSESVGFHHVSTFGGPIKQGMQVKIWYAFIDGDPSIPAILRLDIVDHSE